MDCKDGTILKPVMLNTRKGERERYFYGIINGVTSPNPYFDHDSYDTETLAILKRFTPVYRELVTFPEHPDGKIK